MSTAPDVQTPGAGVLPGLPAGGGSARGLRAALCRAFVAALGRVDNPALLPLALAQAQALVPAGANGLALLHEFADSPGWPARYLAARLLGERSATAGRQVMAHAWPVLERLAADRERWVAEGAAWGFGALLRADPAYWGPRFVSVFADLPPSVPPTGDHAEGDGRSAGDHDAAAPPAVRRALLFGVVPALRDGPADARQVALEVIDRAAGDPSSATRQLGSLVAGRELAAHLPQEALALVERWAASGDPARQWQAARALTPTVRSIDRDRVEAVIARLQQAADPAVRSALRGALKDEVASGQWPVASGGGGVRPGRAGSGRAHIDNGWDEEDGLERNARPARPGSGPSGAGPEARPALGEPGASGAPRAGTGHWPVATGHWSEDWQTTADIPISASLIEQMVGQDRAVEIVRLAARQRRFVLMVGEPGTGKSMLAAAMAEMMGADHDGGLEDILVLPNAESRITPLIEAVPAGEGERRVREAKKRRGETETAITFLFWAASLAASLIAGWYALATRSAVPGIVAAVVIAVLWGVRRFFRSPVRLSVPKLLVTNARAVEANLAPFVDATGFHAGALLGDVRHDPFQSGGYETPPHELVEPGAIHLAHRGVLFIDEVSTSRSSRSSRC